MRWTVWRFELQTPLSCSLEAAWEAVQQRTLLEYITHPLLKMMPLGLASLPGRFQRGTYYPKLYFGFFPLGRRTIRVLTLSPSQHLDYTRESGTEESGTLAKTLKRHIELRADAEGQTVYRDTLELDAGRFTPVVWVFAQFYRYRQHRWRALARTLRADPS